MRLRFFGNHSESQREAWINAHSYLLWEQAGCPEGRAEEFWLESEATYNHSVQLNQASILKRALFVIAIYALLAGIGWGIGFRRIPHKVSLDIECETINLPAKQSGLSLTAWNELALLNGQGTITFTDRQQDLSLQAPSPNANYIDIKPEPTTSSCNIIANGSITISAEPSRSDAGLVLKYLFPPIVTEGVPSRLTANVNDYSVDYNGFSSSAGSLKSSSSMDTCQATLQQMRDGKSSAYLSVTYACASEEASTNTLLTKLANIVARTATPAQKISTDQEPIKTIPPSHSVSLVPLQFIDDKYSLKAEWTFSSGTIICTRCKGFVHIGDSLEPLELKGFPDLTLNLTKDNFTITQLRAVRCGKDGNCSNSWILKLSGRGRAAHAFRDDNDLIPSQLSEILERPIAKQNLTGLLILGLLFLAYKFVEPAVAAFVKFLFPEIKETK